MPQTEHESFEISIRNAAAVVSAEYGVSAVKSVFTQYGAEDFDDLLPAHYADVLNDLEMRAEGI